MTNINQLVRPCIANLTPYSSARDEFSGSASVFLDANENPFGVLNRYPDPKQQELKNKLAALKGVNCDQIFIGNGSDELIDLAFRIFCEPGQDKALTFTPTYGMYKVSAAINNVAMEYCQLDSSFGLDWDTIATKAKDSTIKLVFLCSPNNPTGNSFSHEEIARLASSFNALVIVDEAYIDFSPESSSVTLLQKCENIMVSQTFSKAWGLAGARVGMGFANNNIIDFFNRVKPPYNVSQLNQTAAIKALENKRQFEANLKLILSEKERLVKALASCKDVLKIYPSDANFLLVEFTNANAWYKALVDQKIIIRNRTAIVPNCLRITVGSPEENNKLLNALLP